MRLPKFRVRTLIIAVAVSAALLAGGLELVRLRRLSTKYRYAAWAYGTNVQMSLSDLARLKPKFQKLRASSNPDRTQVELLGVTIMWLEAKIAANANLVQIYEHMAEHPWESPPLIAEAGRGVEDAPIPKRFLTNSAPTPPPAPPPDHAPGRTTSAPPAPPAPASPLE